MKAAINFSFGDGDRSHEFKSGDTIPTAIADQLDDKFILEKVAKKDPSELTRDQLIMLAGLNESVDDLEPIDWAGREDELIETLRVLKTKGDVIDWFEQVHPANGLLEKQMLRDTMIDIIVEELTGEADEDE